MNGIAQKYTCSFWRSKMKPHVAGSQRGARRKRPPMFLSKRRLPATQGEEQTAEDTPQPYLRVNYLSIFCRLGLLFFVCIFAIQALICGVSLLMALSVFAETILFVLAFISFASGYICEYNEQKKYHYISCIAAGLFILLIIILTFILL